MEKETLNKLYETTKGGSTPVEYDRLMEKYKEEKEKFLEKVGKENRSELERLTDILQDMENELTKQGFCEGASILVKLLVDCLYQSKEDI